MLSSDYSWKRSLLFGAAAALLLLVAAIGFDPALAGKKNREGGGGGGGKAAQACPPGYIPSKKGCKLPGGNKAQANRPNKAKAGKPHREKAGDDRPKAEAKRHGKEKAAEKRREDGRGKGKGPNVAVRCDPPMVYSRRAKACIRGKDLTAGTNKGNGKDHMAGPGKERGHGKDHGDNIATTCDSPMVYSRKAKGCVHRRDHGGDDVVTNCDPPMVYSRKAKGCIHRPDHEPQVTKCRPPMIYSRKAGACVIEPQIARCHPPKYYSHRARACVKPRGPEIASCDWPWIRVGYGCVCAPGFFPRGGHCIVPPLVPVGPIPGGPPQVRPLPEPPILEARPGMPPGPAAPRPPRPRIVTPNPEAVAANVDNHCLPDDLYDLMQETYGARPGVSRCPAACLPKPSFFTQEELDAVAEKGGIEWCENCLQVGSYMPLASIRLLERVANVNICVNPDMCRLPAGYGGGDEGEREVEIRTIFKELPKGIDNEGNLAVVIGNRDYDGELPLNSDGHADADAVVTLLTDQLGYKQENIIDLRDATLADLERVFGSDDNPGGEIAERIDKDDPGDVFVYIASHGFADEADDNKVYLLPIDARLDDLDDSAYALQDLYQNLGKTGARTTMLMLEANFAKNLDELIDPPNLPELEVEAMPAEPVPGLAVFKASDRDQKTIQDPEYGIGLFTRYLIEGLAGKADEAPLGNNDKRIDTVELYVYTADSVRTAARKSFGLEQKPLLSKIDNLVVGSLASK